MPERASDLGPRLGERIVATVPDVFKAVKWNQPFYGVEDEGWFVSFRCLTKYVKVTFFRDSSLDPVAPGSGKQEEQRWLISTRTTSSTRPRRPPGSPRPASFPARRYEPDTALCVCLQRPRANRDA